MNAALAAERAAPAYRPPLEIATAFLDRAPVLLSQMAAALALLSMWIPICRRMCLA